jgi:hypothetical protein
MNCLGLQRRRDVVAINIWGNFLKNGQIFKKMNFYAEFVEKWLFQHDKRGAYAACGIAKRETARMPLAA